MDSSENSRVYGLADVLWRFKFLSMDAKQAGRADDLFYDAFKASPIGIALEDLDGQPLFVNSALCAMLGFSEQELLRKHCAEFSPPEDAEKDWALFQQLRAGSIDRYSLDKRYFRRDGSLIWGRLSISLLNDRASPLVVAMVEDITEKRTAQEKFSKAFQHSPTTLSITSAKDHRYIDVNKTFERLTGYSREEAIGRTPFDLGTWVNPFQRMELAARLLAEGKVNDVEARFRKKDGEIWVGSSSFELIEIDREPCILTITIDITERKLAEQALSTVNQRLIEAQEEERARIARELHDDINQQVALLTVNLETVRQSPPASAVEFSQKVGEAIKGLETLGNDVQALSHRLHSSKLEHLGLVTAAESFCKELSSRQELEIEFHSEGVPNDLPKEISVCLFRVLQEAVQNVAKHSGSRYCQVSLRGGSSDIRLIVSDSGSGFDSKDAMRGRGLGIVSMKERLKLVNGDLSVHSQPQRGTTIQALVPVIHRMKSAGARG